MKFSGPRLLLGIEGFVVLLVACILYRNPDGSWGKFAALFLVPDLFILGYVFGPKTGARLYNAVHTYTAPLLLWLIAHFAGYSTLVPLCLIWVAHIGFDRLLGYGLKYDTAFKDTHLGKV